MTAGLRSGTARRLGIVRPPSKHRNGCTGCEHPEGAYPSCWTAEQMDQHQHRLVELITPGHGRWPGMRRALQQKHARPRPLRVRHSMWLSPKEEAALNEAFAHSARTGRMTWLRDGAW